MKKLSIALAALGLTVAAGLATATPALAAPAADWSCPGGYVCFYTGVNGTGARCAWDVSDSDWLRGDVRCSWASIAPTVVSAYVTTGTAGSVRLYSGVNYSTEVDCITNGRKQNYSPNRIRVLSHRLYSNGCQT
ncbi:peptidase inhibitor family I36 protein [Streptomyces sp. NPDC127033]|uniref:peptidase inhibitor family I36 protein n=1 Tax=Streptomyces sp. NPDC127033 TaxID=3347110 RepID=UPI0036471671